MTLQRNTRAMIPLTGSAELVDSLEHVGSPYEVLLTHPEWPEALVELDGSEPIPSVRFEVTGGQPPDRFKVATHLNDDYVGRGVIRITRKGEEWGCALHLTDISGSSEDARVVRETVEDVGLEVHFATEHLLSRGLIYRRPAMPQPFHRYVWSDFGSTNIFQEKPEGSPTEMRRLIGLPDDNSLFGWAVRTYSKGWLVCDDGSNEVADFIWLSDDGLTLFAIKSAWRGGRSTSTDCIHLVQAQAAKNLGFLNDLDLLHDTLHKRRDRLVVFLDGVRQESPDGFLTALALSDQAFTRRGLTIVQPQLERSEVREAHTNLVQGRRLTNDLGMMRIDSMLRAASASCADIGIDFSVLGRIDPAAETDVGA